MTTQAEAAPYQDPAEMRDDYAGNEFQRDRAIGIAKEFSALFPEAYVAAGFMPHEWVVRALVRAHILGCRDGFEDGRNVGITQAEAKHHLIQDAQAEAVETFGTSLIRAAMAGTLESAADTLTVDRDFDSKQLLKASIVINPDAQRTIWDRYDLAAERTPDGQSVIFSITRK